MRMVHEVEVFARDSKPVSSREEAKRPEEYITRGVPVILYGRRCLLRDRASPPGVVHEDLPKVRVHGIARFLNGFGVQRRGPGTRRCAELWMHFNTFQLVFLLFRVFCTFRVPPTDKDEKGLAK